MKTYSIIPHHATGNAEIHATGRTGSPDVSQPCTGKKKLSTWDLKEFCELNKITDSINYFDRATIQRAERRKKR